MSIRSAEPATDVTTANAGEEHVVIFRLANENYAIDIQSVQEIVRMQAITAIPGAADYIEGITNLRGRVVPVIDLRKRCGIAASDHTAETRIVVVSNEGSMVGLVVDAVTEVLRIPADDIEYPSGLMTGPENSYLRGTAKLDNRLVSLMDLEGLLPAEQIVEEETAPARKRSAA
jgi:purine-binding chemotaxis protein CheW